MASSLDSSILFGVFDGHGEFGGEASTQIAQMLPTNVYEGKLLDCSLFFWPHFSLRHLSLLF